MEKISQIAVPYAKALFDLAIDKNVLEDVTRDMQTLVSLCKSNKEFLLMLKSPILKTDKKKDRHDYFQRVPVGCHHDLFQDHH